MIGDNIKKFRKIKKLTQEELGNRLGVSAAMISQWERGERNPRTENLQKIASALDVSIGDLTDLVELPFQYNLIYARRKAGFTIEELSSKTGIAEKRLRDFESGVELPTNEEVDNIGEKTEAHSFINNPIKAPNYATEMIKYSIGMALPRNSQSPMQDFLEKETARRELLKSPIHDLIKSPVQELIKDDLYRKKLLDREFTKEELEEDLLSEIEWLLNQLNYDGKVKVVEQIELLTKIPEYKKAP